jgi:transposase
LGTFSANRERLLNHDVARKFFKHVVTIARSVDLLSDAHFSVDGTLLEAMGSSKACGPKTRNKIRPRAGSSSAKRDSRRGSV